MRPRIASLLPAATEIVAELGLQDQLVGVSHECDYPPGIERLAKLTRSVIEPTLSPAAIDERVRSLNQAGAPLYLVEGDLLRTLAPDLVVTQGQCDVCAVSESAVRAELLLQPWADVTSGATLVSLMGLDVAGVLGDVMRVANAAGLPERGEAVISTWQARWDALPGPPDNPPRPPRVIVLEWPDPPFAAGHWVPQQVSAAGGVEALAGDTPGQPSRRVTWDAIAAADPDLIVLAACGHNVARNAAHAGDLRQESTWTRLRAVREGQVWAVDANAYFSRPTPRLIAGAELLHAILTEQTDTLNPAVAQRVYAVGGTVGGVVDL